MKKIVILGLTTLIVLSIGIYTYLTSKNEESIDKKEKQIKSTNMLTMMLETEAGTGVYEETTASEWPIDGYEFNETLSKCENGSELSWDNNLKKVIFASTKADKCYIYFDIKKDPTFADYIIDEVYSVDGANDLYYHDGVGTYTNADQEAGDNSYRYSGANPNNYVCFGSDAATCPNDNLYRIIGLFDDDKDGIYNIKLIKHDYTTSDILGTDGRDYVGLLQSFIIDNYKGNMDTNTIATYRWNNDESISEWGSNNWTTSELNIINLNDNYINYLYSINSKWVEMIDNTTTWYLGGVDGSDYTAKEFYEGERNNLSYGNNPITYKNQIGLMYPSDYGYAISPEGWSNSLDYYYNESLIANNWMFMGLNEWTITHYLYDKSYVYRFYYDGGFSYDTADSVGVVRPTFYLTSNVLIMDGNGSLNSPYRLSL